MKLWDKFASLFRNSSLSSPSDDFVNAIFGGTSLSGTRVSESTALGVATVFACVSLLSRVMATLPLKLYEQNGKRRTEAVNHPVYDLLSTRPNPEQTAADVRGALMSNLALRGNAYAYIVRDRAERPRELWPLHSSQVEPYRDRNQLLRYRILGRHWADNTTTLKDVPFFNMLHLRGMTMEGQCGLGPMLQARECIGLAIALEDNAAKFFGNGSRPGLILESQSPMGITEKQRQSILDQIKADYGGTENAYKTMVLDGLKMVTARATNEQSQFDESRNRQAVEVCKLFNVPPHKVGILDNATFSNIEQQQIQFTVDVIGPLCVQWEQALAGSLLTDIERRKFFLKHNLNALQRGDFKTRVDGYAIMIQNGIMSPNEARAYEEMDPRDGGDEFLTPLNMSTGAGGDPATTTKAKLPSNRLNGHDNEIVLS